MASGSQLCTPMVTLLMLTIESTSMSSILPVLRTIVVAASPHVDNHMTALVHSTRVSRTLLYRRLFILLRVARLLVPQCWISRNERSPRYSHSMTTTNRDTASTYASIVLMKSRSSA